VSGPSIHNWGFGDMAQDDALFEWVDGTAHFRGLPVQWLEVTIAGRPFKLAGLADAADLLDQPEFAEPFLSEDRAPYGMELWPAATMLAEHILHGEEGTGRRALEIGCGLGLVAMAATLKGWRVHATDHEPVALRFAEYNAALNGIAITAFQRLDWHEPVGEVRFDRVFGADVLYERTSQVPVLKCLRDVLDPGGHVLLADPNRGVADGFAAIVRQEGFDVSIIRASGSPKHGRTVQGRIFRLHVADATPAL
jgi:predicted nicotinamide N-methyase